MTVLANNALSREHAPALMPPLKEGVLGGGVNMVHRYGGRVWSKSNPPNPRGQTTTPAGRRSAIDVVKLCRSYAPDLLQALSDIGLDKRINAQTRIQAIDLMLKRGYGPVEVAVQIYEQHNTQVNVTGNAPGTSQLDRDPIQALPIKDQIKFMREVAQVLLESGGLSLDEPAVPKATELAEAEPDVIEMETMPGELSSLPSDPGKRTATLAFQQKKN